MKFSIFKKVALWLFLIITAVELVLFVVLFSYTYNKIIDKSTAAITKAAKSAAKYTTFYDPDTFKPDSGDDIIIATILSSGCDQYDIDRIYLLTPDPKDNSVKYTARGISSKESAKYDTHIVDDMYGDLVEGGMTAEMQKAFDGDESGVTAHIKNDKENKLACYMPVKNYAEPDNEDSTTITGLISAEISLDRIMADFNTRFRELALVMIVVTVTVGISAALILYFKVTKPIKIISKRMNGFVSEHDSAFEKLPVKGSDELAEMLGSFNTMAEEIDQYVDDVAELNRQNAELNIAQGIQLGLLEPPRFQNGDVAISASMATARVVGGDLYDYHVLENGSVFVAIADVSGKGITAALFMSRAITLLKNYAELGYSPSKMLYEYNNNLAGHNPNMMFITTFAAVYDPKTHVLTYSNAGHNYPYILSDRLIKLDGENGIVAGAFEGESFPEHKITMKPGDLLFMYTDGVTEANNKSKELFGEERLERLLREVKEPGGEGVLNAVTIELEAFAEGAEQADDITMLALQAAPLSEKTPSTE